MKFFILKIQGKAKIPDYIQIRDEHYTLIAYFRVDRPEKGIEKMGLGHKMSEMLNIINELPFGKMKELTM